MSHASRPKLLHLLLALLLALVARPDAFAEPAPKPEPVPQKWLAVFEQSYGSEGLYVLELHPTDKSAPSRLNLQLLNATAQQFRTEFPNEGLSLDALKAKGKLPELQPAAAGEVYTLDAATGLFTSSLGGDHTPLWGVARLIEGNRAIRQRLVNPDGFTRSRWGRIFADPDAPEIIRNEITLREFMLDHYNFPDAVLADKVQRQLAQIRSAAELYAFNHNMKNGDPIDIDTLIQAGLLSVLESLPKEVSVEYRELGKDPVATFGVYTITPDPESVTTIRRQHAEEQLKQLGRFPPAMALIARFNEPPTAVKMLDAAIKVWPDVPGLRIERMAHEARRRNFAAWTKDLDYLLQRFPAAPLLIEVEVAAENGQISSVPALQARIATLMADIRPDLLTQQLYAIKVLQASGKAADAQTVYDRLVFGNPAWKHVLPRPETPPAPTPVHLPNLPGAEPN